MLLRLHQLQEAAGPGGHHPRPREVRGLSRKAAGLWKGRGGRPPSQPRHSSLSELLRAPPAAGLDQPSRPAVLVVLPAGETPHLHLLPRSFLQEMSPAEPRHQLHQAGRDRELDLPALRHEATARDQGGALAARGGGEGEATSGQQDILSQDTSRSREVA